MSPRDELQYPTVGTLSRAGGGRSGRDFSCRGGGGGEQEHARRQIDSSNLTLNLPVILSSSTESRVSRESRPNSLGMWPVVSVIRRRTSRVKIKRELHEGKSAFVIIEAHSMLCRLSPVLMCSSL